MLNLIAAVSDNDVIGIDDTIPWRLKSDMQYFKKVTMDNAVIMGRNTYDSLFAFMKDKEAEPLPGRVKIIVTHNPTGVTSFKNFKMALAIDANSNLEKTLHWLELQVPGKQFFVIGGSQIYSLFNGYYRDLYITRVHKTVETDDRQSKIYKFPINESVLSSDYELLYSDNKQADENNECDYTFQQWRLKNLI